MDERNSSHFSRFFALQPRPESRDRAVSCDEHEQRISARTSQTTAGGEFTWPPTSEELDAIEVIPLDGFADGSPAPHSSHGHASPVTRLARPRRHPAALSARPRHSSSPPSARAGDAARSTASAFLAARAAPRGFRLRRRRRSRRRSPSRSRRRMQLSDRWRAPSQNTLARTRHAGHGSASPTASPVANVALLQLVEKGPSRTWHAPRWHAAPSPLTATLTPTVATARPRAPAIAASRTRALARAAHVTHAIRATITRHASRAARRTRAAPRRT